MARATFEAQKTALDDACAFLRSFTLGRRGFTPRDGAAGIERVNAECERLKKHFATGPHAKQAATAVAAGAARIVAAEARLALLSKKK